MPPGQSVIKESIERMGQKIGTIHAHLWSECVELNRSWGEFRTLFADKENFEIFNSQAPSFLAISSS
jgi:hypothetical protein